MWECSYGKEPVDIRLLMLRFLRKSPVLLLAALLGMLCVGGPYFLVKVTFGPAKEYEAVTDFYIDYAVQENGEEYTYFNQTTWTQLITDDVFTDKILINMADGAMNAGDKTDDEQGAPLQDGKSKQGISVQESKGKEKGATDFSVQETEKAAGLTKQELREYLYATMLSDTRIVTTTVTTNDPELTMKIEKALVRAMEEFGEEQKEIAGVRILQEPEEASLVAADVRTFRACMLGMAASLLVTMFYLLIYFVLDEGIYIPATFERRYGVPMLGTVRSPELKMLAEKLFSGKTGKPILLAVDERTDLKQVEKALAERGVLTAGTIEVGAVRDENEDKKILLIVKAGAHNGKRIEKTLDICRKCGVDVTAALLWDADERLISAYETPEHVLYAWRRLRRDPGGKKDMD